MNLHFLVDSGLRIEATVLGDPSNDLVILLHGGGQTRHAWGATTKKLSESGFYALAIDLRGHGDSDWSQAHIEDEVEGVAELIAHRFKDLTDLSPAAGGYYRLHRWRYASVAQPAGAKYLHDDALKLSAIGDWCLGGKVEDAFTSGYSLAKQLNAEFS